MIGRIRVVEVLFLLTCFCVTFEKIHWNLAGAVGIADIFTVLFLIAFVATRLMGGRRRIPKTTAIVLAFALAFLLVYLLGFFDLDTKEALSQWTKGMVKYVIHIAFVAAAVSYLARRSTRFYVKALRWLIAGLAFNAAYGVAQLLFARAGHNLDSLVLSPLTGGSTAINIYGRVNGVKIFRSNALTGDPNHLGIMLIVPILILAPLYLRLRAGSRDRRRLASLLGFFLLVEILTLSRSGLLGLVVGAAILAVPYRRRVLTRAALVPVVGVLVVLAAIAATRRHYVAQIIRSRLETGGKNGQTSAHFAVYNFVPQILHSHPLFGLGLNNFSVYYEFVTGKSNWGPHSFYVALIVETGVIGATVFAAFLLYVFLRLRAALSIGRVLARKNDRRAAWIRPLAWGFSAAIAGTMAANIFYLTMQFYYFYAVLAFALALPLVFGRGVRLQEAAARAPARPAAAVAPAR
jgi:O-antigen ligase